jgi:hypothetical protein
MGRHDQSRLTGCMQLEEQPDYTFAVFRIEIARRLIGKHNFRIVDQRPANGYPLLFPTGKLFGKILAAVAKPYPVKECLRLNPGIGVFSQFGRKHHVFNAIE